MKEKEMLGCVVEDKVTGFKGVVTGVATYLTGCSQALVVPKAAEDGASREGAWIDVQRLKVDETTAPVVLNNSATPGPDRSPSRRM